jgi:hypothetical protein
MTRDHFVPAAFLGRFSTDEDLTSRSRRLIVFRPGTPVHISPVRPSPLDRLGPWDKMAQERRCIRATPTPHIHALVASGPAMECCRHDERLGTRPPMPGGSAISPSVASPRGRIPLGAALLGSLDRGGRPCGRPLPGLQRP